MAEVQEAAESAAKKNKNAATRKKATGPRKTAAKVANKQSGAARQSAAKSVGRSRRTIAPPATPEERHRLIAESAFLKAESRGFAGGDPVADWLEAEEEVDRTLAD